MPKVCYVGRNFRPDALALIAQANQIIAEYEKQGLVLSLRQLYYQCVARNIIANKQSEYKRLGSIVNDARLAGRIDWNAIEDRTRSLSERPSWDSPEDIVAAVARQYRRDKWEKQDYRVEVWVEKDALGGVFDNICQPLQIAVFACRGYVSQSSMWEAAQRLRQYEKGEKGKRKSTVILHFGDHDPSGIDMTRDIRERLDLFGCSAEVRRVALNMNQIEELSPPPNPAKETDARFASYRDQFGDESWELDALDPKTLRQMVVEEVEALRDPELWEEAVIEEDREREQLKAVSDGWEDVVLPALAREE